MTRASGCGMGEELCDGFIASVGMAECHVEYSSLLADCRNPGLSCLWKRKNGCKSLDHAPVSFTKQVLQGVRVFCKAAMMIPSS